MAENTTLAPDTVPPTPATCAPNMWGDDCSKVCGYCEPTGITSGKEINIIITPI